jgi:hypothetical protein
MVHRSPGHVSIIDLGNQTITNIDLEKKTYSVMTFDQMKQALEQMQQKMSESRKGAASQPGENKPDVDMNFKISVNNTGKSKQIEGMDAKERVMTIALEATDKKSGQSGAMVVLADQWIAPKVPGYDEIRDFYRRMAEKINWTPDSNMFMGRPDVSQSMAEVAKETAKLDGIAVFTTTTMGPEGTQPIDRSDKSAQPAQQSQGPSAKSVLGGALKGRFGLGGRKKDPEPEQQPASGPNGGSASGVLIEMTTELRGFSNAPADPSLFEVPAGFKKIEPELNR